MKKIEVNQGTCIGCGACVQIAPEYFKFSDNGTAVPIKEVVDEVDNLVVEAMESCPTSAISIEDEE